MSISVRARRGGLTVRTFYKSRGVGSGTALANARARIAQVDAERPIAPFLIDSFRRHHDYLRISLTERCNLRCFYCMPSEGVELSPPEKILTDDEIIRLSTLFVKNGVRKIRLTGGEPTVRKGILDIVARLNQLRSYGLESIAMTSNGLALHRRLPHLIENGLSHLNLSLDTLDPFKFELMTRRMGHDAVLRSLDVALNHPGLQTVKLNVVVVRGLNDSEVLDFVALTKDRPLSVRFIEFMPFSGNKWDKGKMVPSSELLSHIRSRHADAIRIPEEMHDTSRSWMVPGYKGSFGFISSMSDHFCATCNRLRITADGKLKVCLFDSKEVSLRDKMRGGATDTELMQIIGQAVFGKQEKHAGMENIDVVTNRPMILIGALSRKTRILTYRQRDRTMLPHPRSPSSFGLPAVHARHFASSAHGNLTTGLTHLDQTGQPAMVDITTKCITKRSATASGRIYIPPIAYELVTSSFAETIPVKDPNFHPALLQRQQKARRKGDPLTVAQLAAIMACKRTSELIPLCHPLSLTHISVNLIPELPKSTHRSTAQIGECNDITSSHSIVCEATVSCEGRTGVEMEALTAVSVGLLTIWDMLKAVAGKEMQIGQIMVTHKEGGRSGDFTRETISG